MRNEVIPPDSRTELMMHYLIYNFLCWSFSGKPSCWNAVSEATSEFCAVG